MKKIILFLCFIGCCFATFSQSQICVDGSSSGSEDGTPSNPYHTIQAAVNAASNGDIIKVAQGTYSEAVQILQKKVQLLGGFAVGGNFNTADPKIYETIISGTSAAPCIYVQIDDREISESLIISGFTIRNGQRGIKLTGGWSGFLNKITIENNIIEDNVLEVDDLEENDVWMGGGIGLEGNNVTIQNNVIRSNKAGRGAGIGRTGNISDFLIADNFIENNTGCDDHGGGVSIDGTGTITRNIFDGNVAAENLGWGWGGGIVITNYDTTKVITLSHNVWRNNHAPDRGGAIFVDEAAKVRMEHELFYNNTTKKSGSAIYVDADWEYNPSVLYMNNCTVSGNSSDEPGGAALYVQSSIAHVENCIFWNNGSDFELITDEDERAIANLTVDYTLTQQGFTGAGNFSSDPLFADASNGDFHVKSTAGRFDPLVQQFVNDDVNSPAIDAGNPTSDYSNEPDPNGERVNLGCYGNTVEASKSGVVGIEEITQNLWTIFPNPAKESITIRDLPSSSSINITDIAGKKVYGSIINDEQTTINTANFADGIYIIQVTSNGTVANGKLVVRK